ncbi:MAG: putative threonine-phosphate decarboxylase [Ilumatobacteraceae bacterium]|nr:putative threonine-phosphate decarboxylase [Ilumatobacteraceae bacterium]
MSERHDRVPGPGAHGGDGAAVAAALAIDPRVILDLSASMNPLAADVTALAATLLARQAHGALTRYPDPRGAAACLADAIGVDPDRLVLTNGGSEAIALVAAEVRTGAVIEPEFSLYRRHLAAVDDRAPRWRSNPSNPLGELAAPDDTAGVWDEAFFALATGRWTRGDDGAWRLGSLTKLWSCPGLRLGYVIAPDLHSAERIRARQPQWSVNGLALALLPELLARTDLAAWATGIARLRDELLVALVGLGIDAAPTSANWLLVRQPDLRRRLAPFGVVVRDCASFGLDGLHRVALPPPAQLDRVCDAFAAVMART